jgi:hypothetical protein
MILIILQVYSRHFSLNTRVRRESHPEQFLPSLALQRQRDDSPYRDRKVWRASPLQSCGERQQCEIFMATERLRPIARYVATVPVRRSKITCFQ